MYVYLFIYLESALLARLIDSSTNLTNKAEMYQFYMYICISIYLSFYVFRGILRPASP